MMDAEGRLALEPIGFFRSEVRHKTEALRQGALDESGSVGRIELAPGRDFEQALRDLDGFERAWIIYGFHLAEGWKPMALPPRGPRVKRGLFATRAPYRPNPIGLSCVRVLAVGPLEIQVAEHDILDGSPIYDIKPYLPYADAFPAARAGWTDDSRAAAQEVAFSSRAERELVWLEERGVGRLRPFLLGQLAHEPFDGQRKRVRALASDGAHKRAVIAHRTWRAEFRVSGEGLLVERILSGYEGADLNADGDPYADKAVHRAFVEAFR